MIHFFQYFYNDPSNTPFGRELLKTGIEHRLFGKALQFHYHSRLGLILRGWPQLILFASRSAWLSLFKSQPHPDVVVLSSHFEVVIFGLASLLLPRKKRPEIVYQSFIYTSRPNPWARRLRKSYFGFILHLTNRIICHSTNEIQNYCDIFTKAKRKFRYVPYGLHISGEEHHQVNLSAIIKTETPYIFSAGRSGRDYSTLTKAVANSGISTHIICDREASLVGINIPSEVNILTNCYGEDYLKQLEDSYIVVIPLQVDDISAGQMVLIQAMAYRKPIIVTRTTTTQEYVQHDCECLMVDRNDSAGLQQAIQQLLNNSELATRIANGARQAYEQRFCTRAYIANMVVAAQR